ncbi:MAG TPA: 3-methyl-2-oxobutanoate hydroxymethyltransferase, partial [Candidatus Krumholzibacteria bacterium]|nr:3-methyl-2-oxobutanoate hydroxymethyltransferase [Candidatus Krumholzibacteria bacterium]
MMAKTTRLDLLRSKKEHRKIAVVTAYDYPTARLVDMAEVDAILVG